MLEFSIIIPTINKNKGLAGNIRQLLLAVSKYNCEIILINDNKERQIDLGFNAEKLFIYNGPGKGAASARNFGVSKSRYNTIIFIDDDIVVPSKGLDTFLQKVFAHLPGVIFLPDWRYPEELMELCRKNAFGRFLIKHKFYCLAGYINRPEFKPNEVIPHDGVASYFLALNKSLFLQVKGYNESIPFAGFEDHDLSSKLMKIPVQIYIDSGFCVFHNEEDKIIPENWFKRIRNGAVTRRKAVEIGYKELSLHYSFFKKLIYGVVLPFEKVLLRAAKSMGTLPLVDKATFSILKTITALNIYKGYTLK